MTHLLGHKRKFGKEYYTARSYSYTKAEALSKKKFWKNRGWKVRIVKTKSPMGTTEYYLFTKR